METQLRDVMVEALTIDNVPMMQSARLEDYSPELWALTGSKGAAVMHMLRFVVGDEKFFAGAEELRAAERLEIGQHGRFQEGRGDGLAGRIWATSSSSGSNRAARRNSSWSTRFSARRKASA